MAGQAEDPREGRPRIHALVIDDDEAFREFVVTALEEGGFGAQGAEDAQGGLAILDESAGGTFDLILLDVEMPGPSGWDLLHELRARGNEIPVVFVTARERVEERVKGLRMGADDYLVKPIEFEELVARVEAVVRRRRALSPLEFGDVRIDLARRKVTRAGNPVELTPREFDLLMALVQKGGEVVSRVELLRDVWDLEFDPGTSLLDVHLGRVRRKLDRHGRPLIQTVKGEGYRAVRYSPADA